MSHEYPSPKSWDTPKPPPLWRRAFQKEWWTHAWGRFRSPFRRSWVEDPFPPPIKMPTLLDVHEPSQDFDFETPALGDAFNFRVRVRCSWTVQATASEDKMEEKLAEVRDFIEQSRGITRDRIEERVRPLARTFPPYRAAEAEKALNETVSDCLNDGDLRVTVRTWVDVSDPVRADLQTVWHNRVLAESASELDSDMKKAQIQLEGDLKKAHVRLLSDLEDAWRKLLIAGLSGLGTVDEANATWLAPYALKIAETTVQGYYKRLLSKTQSRNRPAMVANVLDWGGSGRQQQRDRER